MNKGIIKKMLSIICAISAIGSAVGSVGAAGDDAEANKILSDINKCDTEIENLKDLKAKIEEEKEHELQEIKKKISENKQVLDYVSNLIKEEKDGRAIKGYRQQYNQLKGTTDGYEKKLKEISNEKIKMIQEIIESLNNMQNKRKELVKKFDELFDNKKQNNKQSNNNNVENNKKLESTKEKFDKTKKEFMDKYHKYSEWIRSEKLGLNDDGNLEQRRKLFPLGVSLKKDFRVDKAEEYIKLANESMREMEKFEQSYKQNKNKKRKGQEKQRLVNKQKDLKTKQDTTKKEQEEREKIKSSLNLMKQKSNMHRGSIYASNNIIKEFSSLISKIDNIFTNINSKNLKILQKEYNDIDQKFFNLDLKCSQHFRDKGKIIDNLKNISDGAEYDFTLEGVADNLKKELEKLSEDIKKLIKETDQYSLDDCTKKLNDFKNKRSSLEEKMKQQQRDELYKLKEIVADRARDSWQTGNRDLFRDFTTLKDEIGECIKKLRSANIFDYNAHLTQFKQRYNDLNSKLEQNQNEKREKQEKLERERKEKERKEKEKQEKEKKQKDEVHKECGKVNQDFETKNDEFMMWMVEKGISAPDDLSNKIKEVESLSSKVSQGKELSVETMKKFIRLAKETMRSMDGFKEKKETTTVNGNKFSLINNNNINEKNAQPVENNDDEFSLFNDDNRNEEVDVKIREEDSKKLDEMSRKRLIEEGSDFASLLAGDQHTDNNYEGIGEKITNTCAVHMATTAMNIYNFMESNGKKPICGFKNVIKNYLDNGGKKEYIGKMMGVDQMENFLKNIDMGAYSLRFDEVVNGNFKDEVKKKVEHVKEIIKSTMKGKKFAPIGTVSGGHWQLLTKYDEKTNMVLRLDSAPNEAKWVDLDTIATNAVVREEFEENSGLVQGELLFLKKGKGMREAKFGMFGDNQKLLTEKTRGEFIENLNKFYK